MSTVLSFSGLVILICNKPPPKHHFIMFTGSVGQKLKRVCRDVIFFCPTCLGPQLWWLMAEGNSNNVGYRIYFQGGFLIRSVAPWQGWLEGCQPKGLPTCGFPSMVVLRQLGFFRDSSRVKKIDHGCNFRMVAVRMEKNKQIWNLRCRNVKIRWLLGCEKLRKRGVKND